MDMYAANPLSNPAFGHPQWFGPQPQQQQTAASNDHGRQRTLQPSVTGTSVIGCKFAGGVILAADTLGSYGSMARFRSLPRLMKVNSETVMSAAGDYADYQFLASKINQIVIDESVMDDGFYLPPAAFHAFITRELYRRRSRFNPLWNTITVAGFTNGTPFLGTVDKIGIAYEANSVASGFGAYIAQPLLRKALEEEAGALTRDRAVKVIDDCMRVLFYRDARSLNKYDVAIVTKDGVEIEHGKSADTQWDIAKLVEGFE